MIKLLLLLTMLVMGLGQKHELYSRAKPETKICVVVKDKLLLCKLIKLNQLSKTKKVKQALPSETPLHTVCTSLLQLNANFPNYTKPNSRI